jgi:hypothetical protein
LNRPEVAGFEAPNDSGADFPADADADRVAGRNRELALGDRNSQSALKFVEGVSDRLPAPDMKDNRFREQTSAALLTLCHFTAVLS